MNLGILTCTTPNRRPLYQLTNITKMKFASSRLNVQYVFDGNFSNQDGKMVYWNKILFCRKYISKFDWILWLDDDAGIVDQGFNIDLFLDSISKDKIFLAASDENGFNAGVFFLRNDIRSANMLDFAYNDLYENFKNTAWQDQEALKYWITLENNKDLFQEIPGSIFNAHHQGFEVSVPNSYCDSTFIVHVAGGDGRKLLLSKKNGGLSEIYKLEQCLC